MPKQTPTIHQPREAVEIVDGRDRPLGVMALAEAQRQALFHRTVLVLLYDAKGRVFLQKRSRDKRLYPGRWDLSATGHVQAGESREDAALRELEEELGIRAARMTRLAEIEARPETGYGFVTLFSAGICAAPIMPNPAEVEDGMFMDRDELDALVGSFREMLTPALVFFWERDMVFRPAPDRAADKTPADQDTPDDDDFDFDDDEAPDGDLADDDL